LLGEAVGGGGAKASGENLGRSLTIKFAALIMMEKLQK